MLWLIDEATTHRIQLYLATKFTKVFAVSQINAMLERVRAGKARYRVVLQMEMP